MSDDLKEKLRDYADGKLSLEEKAKIEREIDKLETYQAFIEEELSRGKPSDGAKNNPEDDVKKETQIINKAKWKARLHNAFTALAIMMIGTFLCGILSALFYGSGDPDRGTIYRDVVESAIAVTEPNMLVRGSGTSVNPFFTMDFTGNLQKEIGSEMVDVGEVKISFLFNQVRYPERTMRINHEGTWPFRYPKSDAGPGDEWDRLQKLPEGTVAEAYLSFNRFFSTNEVLKKFQDKNMEPVWFAVDTGFDDAEKPFASIIGFPYQPIWHPDDMVVTNRTYEKKGLFTRVISESGASPTVEAYGSADIREENFTKTLNLLQKYEKMANLVVQGGQLRLTERINYINKNGMRIYGIVVTGPTKEILKLKRENWITTVHVGEVRLWNWSR